MTDMFKKIELVGTSPDSISAAIANAVAKASATVKHMRWFEVVEQRGRISKEGKVDQYQVTIRVGVDYEG
jgi:dodecin